MTDKPEIYPTIIFGPPLDLNIELRKHPPIGRYLPAPKEPMALRIFWCLGNLFENALILTGTLFWSIVVAGTIIAMVPR